MTDLMGEINAAEREIDNPHPGYWLIQLVKNGPEVPACIQYERTTHEPGNPENIMDRSPQLVARINGEPVPLESVWLRRGRPTNREEHDYRVADFKWCRKYQPQQPKADPTRPIDLLKAPIPF